jgi:hypothetical protein
LSRCCANDRCDPGYNGLPQPTTHTSPSTTHALRLTSLPLGTAFASAPSATSIYSSVRNELDFHPQLWLTENTSGALANRVWLAPVALAQLIVKYADTDGRVSRYGAGGGAGACSEYPWPPACGAARLATDVLFGSDDETADTGVVLRVGGWIDGE